MAKKAVKEQHANTQPVEYLGTKKEDVVAEMEDVYMDQLFPERGSKEKAVIAKDKNGMYITGKSYVGSGLLDPYKLYCRIEVTERDGEYFFNK